QETVATPPEYWQALAASHHDLGTILARLPGRRRDAKLAYHEALKIQQKLTRDHAGQVEFARDQAKTLNNLGILLWTTDAEAAEKAFRGAIAIHQDLLKRQAKNPAFRRDLARSYNNLGGLFLDKRNWPKAEEHHGLALPLLSRLVDDFPTVPGYRH